MAVRGKQAEGELSQVITLAALVNCKVLKLLSKINF